MLRALAIAFSLVPATALAGFTGIAVTPADCRLLERHQPAPDVAYRPGVDVRGRPVAPADLGGAPGFELPPVLEFTLALDPFEYGARRDLAAIDRRIAALAPGDPHLPALRDAREGAARAVGLAAPGLGDSSLAVGRVQLDTRTGAVLLDGRPLGPREREAMALACRAAPGR
jgi:hypothetical protein